MLNGLEFLSMGRGNTGGGINGRNDRSKSTHQEFLLFCEKRQVSGQIRVVRPNRLSRWCHKNLDCHCECSIAFGRLHRFYDVMFAGETQQAFGGRYPESAL